MDPGSKDRRPSRANVRVSDVDASRAEEFMSLPSRDLKSAAWRVSSGSAG